MTHKHQKKIHKVGFHRQVHALLEVKKLSTCRTLIDYAAFLSCLFVVFLWIKATSVGIASVPAFDLCLLPVTLVWLVYAAVFQGDLLPHTGWTVTRRKAIKFCFVGCTVAPGDLLTLKPGDLRGAFLQCVAGLQPSSDPSLERHRP